MYFIKAKVVIKIQINKYKAYSLLDAMMIQ